MYSNSSKRSYSNRNKQPILNTKIISTLASFVRKGHSTKNFKNITEIPSFKNTNNYFHKTFAKMNFSQNYSKTEYNTSKSNNFNNLFLIEQENQITNPLFTLYNNKFYPHCFKNKNYIKEVYNCLPPLTVINNNNSNASTINNSNINNNSNFYSINNSRNNYSINFYNKKMNEILCDEYENTINNFNNIYRNNGEDLLTDIARSKDLESDSFIEVVKNNELNMDESNFITSVLKDKNKKKDNYSIKLKNEKFTDPKNSLLTLKINNQLVNNVNEAASNYQYNSYVDQINENQANKLKLLIMPKMNVKVMKYSFEINKYQNKFNNNTKSKGDEKSKKVLKINKNLFMKINKKIEEESNNNINNTSNENNQIDKSYKKEKHENKHTKKKNKKNKDNDDLEEKFTVSSTIIRNILILEVKKYYCKYLTHSFNPCSRMGATFTSCYNQLFLFGGLLTVEESDLWMLEIKNKSYSWKKMKFNNEINFNARYGHSCVFFNDSLYIFGGNMNLKKLKYPLEDFLIYSIKNNTMKIGTFKNDNNYSSKSLYIPQRRNHIAQVIGWNMIVHGGIDIAKEYLKENNSQINEEEIRNPENEIRNMDIHSNVLCDFMALDLITFKWMILSNIVYKLKGKKLNRNLKNEVPRVYHSSCVVLSYEKILKGSRLNIYKNNKNLKNVVLENEEMSQSQKFEVKYEGIYIFGGLDEYLKESNKLFILHCFRNPLVFFEPLLKGAPPSPRYMSIMNYNKTLNFITIYGGKDSFRVYNDLYILDIMNFQWIKIDLFGPDFIFGRMGHCGGIIGEKLYIFGGCDENTKYPSSKVLCIELDLLRNKKLSKIYDYAKSTLSQNPKDKTAKNVMDLLREGAEIPNDVYPFLQLDE